MNEPALYIALEGSPPGFDTVVDGKALSRAEEEMALLAEQLGVRPLMEFFSMSREEASAQAQQFNTGLDLDSFSEDWFTAAEGLQTARARLEGVWRNQPFALASPERA